MVPFAIARRREKAIAKLVDRGFTSAEIAPLVHLSGPDSVNRIRRKLKIPARNRTKFRAWAPMHDARIGEMTRLRNLGHSDRKIARELGVSHWTIADWRRRLKLPPGKLSKYDKHRHGWLARKRLAMMPDGKWLKTREVAKLWNVEFCVCQRGLERMLARGWLQNRRVPWGKRFRLEWRRT